MVCVRSTRTKPSRRPALLQKDSPGSREARRILPDELRAQLTIIVIQSVLFVYKKLPSRSFAFEGKTGAGLCTHGQ